MKCCDSKNIIIIEKEMFVCTNCGVIHGYTWIEYDFKVKEHDQDIYNLLKCKDTIYKRKKYLNRKYHLDNRTILFLDESFENIRKHLKLKKFPITKYLNTIYQYYCNKGDIEYKPLTKSIELDKKIILFLDECFENIRKHLKLKRFTINKYLDIVYRYYCNKACVEYKPLTKSIELDNRIILFLDECFENITRYLKFKKLPIHKYLDIVYQYYCNKHNKEYVPSFKSKIIKLDDSIIEILDRLYLKYPHIKIEEPLYDFDVDYL